MKKYTQHENNVIHSSKISKHINIAANKSRSKQKKNAFQTVEDIWHAIENEDIDISYAVIGYTYSNGIPIFNSDDMLNLLIQYGCDMKLALAFLLDFAQVHEHNAETPILMMTSNKMKIFSNLRQK